MPRRTRGGNIGRLNEEINAVRADPTIKTRLAELGSTVSGGSSADLGRLIAEETEKWRRVFKFAGIKLE